jgi:hypothetical protein
MLRSASLLASQRDESAVVVPPEADDAWAAPRWRANGARAHGREPPPPSTRAAAGKQGAQAFAVRGRRGQDVTAAVAGRCKAKHSPGDEDGSDRHDGRRCGSGRDLRGSAAS